MKCSRVLLFLLFTTCGVSQPILAHGAKIDYQQASAVVVKATFDDGTPMANAQAVVYSPRNPNIPWAKGVTDESGKFIFVPESGLSGDWEVKIRQSGHGKIVSIPLGNQEQAVEPKPVVESKQIVGSNSAIIREAKSLAIESKASSLSNSGYSWQQKTIMSVSIVWGFLGTALFFFANRPNQNPDLKN